MDASVSPAALKQTLRSSPPPLVIDVRREPAFVAAPEMLAGALRRDPARVEEWVATLPRAASVVVYCVHGNEVSRGVAARLGAKYLQGGLEAWRESGGALAAKPAGAHTRWVTRERPKIDRIACPWLVRRFIDPQAEFLYVPTPEVRKAAEERSAVPYDIPEVEFSHVGDECSFDAFLKYFRLEDPALRALAVIVRGADTHRLELAPQCAGLAAVSLGLSRICPGDFEMLGHGMVLYDALYAWCKEGKDEVHTWNPAAYR